MHKSKDKEMGMIEIPVELDRVINHAIFEGKYKSRINRIKRNVSLFVLIFVLCSFIIPLNVFESFADAMIETPGIGKIAKIFTFRNYEEVENKYYSLDVRYPNIDNGYIESKDFHTNMEINRVINKEVEKSKERALEYFTAFVETGGNPNDFAGVDIKVDYEIKCDNENFISFIIKKSETLGNAYNKWYIYNIDASTGDYVKINQFLGKNYQEIVEKSVVKKISEWTEDKRDLLFEGYDISKYIDEDMQYYINNDNNAVVVFSKYTIACGYAGVLEFEIE